MTFLFGRFGYSENLEYRKRIMYPMIALSILVASFFLGLYSLYIPFVPAIIVHILYVFYSMTLFWSLKQGHYFYVKIAMLAAHMTQLTLAVYLWFPVDTRFNLYYIMVPMVAFLTVEFDELRERIFAITASLIAILLYFLSELLVLDLYVYTTEPGMNRFLSGMGVLTILLPMTYIFAIYSRDLYLSHNVLEAMANTDVLTKLANRRVLYENGEEAFELAKEHNHVFTLILFDIDYFKRVNDQYGHPVGDQVLRKLAGLLHENMRAEDTISRYGGEEFAILVRRGGENGLTIANKLLEVISEEAFCIEGYEIHITVSIGVAKYSKDLKDFDHMMNRADNALYKAKDNGRNQAVID